MSSAEEIEKLQSQYSQLINDLNSTTIKQLNADARSVISAPRETTLPALLTVLLDNNILSVPIWDNDEKRYIGFVDVIDICIVFRLQFNKLQTTNYKPQTTNHHHYFMFMNM